MIGRLILFAVLLIIGLAFYTCGVAFDENAEFRRGSPLYYVLVAGEIRGLPVPDEHRDLTYRSFPGDGPAQPFTGVRYTVPGEKAGESLTLFRQHIAGRSCEFVGERKGSELVTAEWSCRGGRFRYSASPDYRRGGDGRYVRSGDVNVSVEYYKNYSL